MPTRPLNSKAQPEAVLGMYRKAGELKDDVDDALSQTRFAVPLAACEYLLHRRDASTILIGPIRTGAVT